MLLGSRFVSRACCNVPRHFSSVSAIASEIPSEFTLAPYTESSAFSFSRGSQYCILTLLHSKFSNKSMADLDVLYETKFSDRKKYVDKLFEMSDRDQSGTLDVEELKRVLASEGLPTNDAHVKQMMTLQGADSAATPDQFHNIITDVWGGRLTLEFRSNLGRLLNKSYSGDRAVVFVGRSALTHQLLRTCCSAWPTSVKNLAIMRNKEPNLDMDPTKMEIFDEIYAPTVPDEVGNVYRFAQKALKDGSADPTAAGGFCVRIQGDGVSDIGEEVFVPLRILPDNSGTGMHIEAPRNFADQTLHIGLWAMIGVTVCVIGCGCSLFALGLLDARSVLLAAGALFVNLGWIRDPAQEGNNTER